MFLTITKVKNHRYLCVSKSVREAGQSKRIAIENLGTIESIMDAHGFNSEDEAIQWAKQYVDSLNDKINTENEEILIKLYPNRVRHLGDKSKIQKLGYIILQKIYYQLGINLICDNIQKRRKVTYDLNNILESLLYARMISPASKLKTSDDVAHYYKWNALEPHQVYRSLSIFANEIDYIQSQLFENSRKVINRKTDVIYYDCSNFFFETEQSEGLKQYGCSKEHRPNPIVQLGLFMDGSGYPLAFCVHSGNTSETQTMIPLEEKIVQNYSLSKFIVCTDAAMAIADNKIFNSAGEKHFVTTQPIKKLSAQYTKWALDPEGWRIYIHMSESDTLEERTEKEKEISKKTTYNLREIDEDKYRNAIFFKKTPFEQDIEDEKGNKIHVDQMLYVTFSVKYKRFLEARREEHIKKAEAAIKRGNPIDNKNAHDYKRLIGKMSCTKEGEAAEITEYFIDQKVIEKEKKYDGFYGISSDIDDNVKMVMNVLKNKWEIEESFRIMKTDFRARPVYLSRDERIKAHMLTCYLTLFLYRILEKHYMRERYTACEIMEAIRAMDGSIVEGTAGNDGINPLFEYNSCYQALFVHTGIMLNKSYLLDKYLSKLIKGAKTTPDKVKRLFDTNKNPVGRPCKGKTKETKQKGKKNNKKDDSPISN